MRSWFKLAKEGGVNDLKLNIGLLGSKQMFLEL
jgi:hypothetical protein